MYQGKHSAQPVESTGSAKPVRSAAPRRRSSAARKPIGLIVALALILCVALGGTVAWLTHQASITNTMSPGSVPITINETLSGTSKTAIKITNDGDVPAYIRVAVVSNKVDEKGHIIPGNANFSFTNTGNWSIVGNYYYYNGVVKPGEFAQFLPENSNVSFAQSEIVIMAQSVQALGYKNGQPASVDVWHAMGKCVRRQSNEKSI